jgi:hypothetical protein
VLSLAGPCVSNAFSHTVLAAGMAVGVMAYRRLRHRTLSFRARLREASVEDITGPIPCRLRLWSCLHAGLPCPAVLQTQRPFFIGELHEFLQSLGGLSDTERIDNLVI